ncbi:MAG: thioredoxin family protein [Lewinellaceae bacterium]|nr:thioredoxin family protein [Lewinellaceae bacterium]
MMRIILLLLFPACLFAQGIDFGHGSLAEALGKAKAEDKLVFVDVYTSWCGPCQLMSSRTFPDSSVGAYYNARFINLKIDAEKGEGAEVARRYGVKYYPTLLFLTAEGTLAHKAVGYFGTEGFLDLGNQANDPEGNLMSLSARYRQGDRNPGLLRRLAELKCAAIDLDAGAMVNDYLKTQSDLSSGENMDFIMEYLDDPYSRGFDFLLKHRAAFESRFSAVKVRDKISWIFEAYLSRHPDLQLGEIQRLLGRMYPDNAEWLASNYRLTYYRQQNDTLNFARAAMDHYARFPSNDADELNEIASLFVQMVDDPAMLEIALEWAQQSVASRETYYNQGTLAQICMKLGRKKQAASAARRAVELARDEGEDASASQALLEKISGK